MRPSKKSLSEVSNDSSLFEAIKRSFTRPSPHLEPPAGGDIQYFGPCSAKIAFVLDFAVTAPELDGLVEDIDSKEKESSPAIHLPSALQGCQFDETNVLVWTFNFKAFSPLDKEHTHFPAPDTSSLNEAFKSHRKLLDHSNARIIFVCGPYAARALHLAFKGTRFCLMIRGFRYHFYVDTSNSAKVSHRLFVLCPGIPARIWSNSQGKSAMLSEAIRFGTKLLGLKGIRPYSIESYSISGSINGWARNERLGKESMTQENMDLDVKLWLGRQGITDEILKVIVKIAGTLPRALLMMFHAINKQPQQTTSFKRPPQPQAQPPQKRHKNRGVWNLSDLSEVGSIVSNAKEEFMQSSRRTSTSPVQQPEIHVTESASSMENKEQDYKSGITLLLGEETVDLDKIKEIRSALSHVHAIRERESIENSDMQDISLADLIPISREAISLGILNQPRCKVTTGWRKNSARNSWKDEDSFCEKEYTYRVLPKPPKGKKRLIRVNYCPVNFELSDDLGDGNVFVKFEICPQGERHPHCYATKSTDVDPAARLGMRLRYQPSSGPEVQKYVTDASSNSVWKANTHVEKLFRVPVKEIACTPRRFLSKSDTPDGKPCYTKGIPGH